MFLKDAVAKYVHDGEYLAIGGFGANRTPIAACHEIVRQRKKNMAFAGHTATHDFQILTAGKVFDKLDVTYVVGLEARGLSPNARRYMQSGEVGASEWTNYCLSARLKAAAMGISFIPARNVMGRIHSNSAVQKLSNAHSQGKNMRPCRPSGPMFRLYMSSMRRI
ncbi:MAG: CoA-transferase [Thermodesulfobacteriota bacterium]|nr:CoA-transferase [Thermodesulfobacteriota bacterium]